MKIFNPSSLESIDRLFKKPSNQSSKNINRNTSRIAKFGSKFFVITNILVGSLISGYLILQGYNSHTEKKFLHDNVNLWQQKAKASSEARWMIIQNLLKLQNVKYLPLHFYQNRIENILYHMKNPVQIKPQILKIEIQIAFDAYFLKYGIKQHRKEINKYGEIVQLDQSTWLQLFGINILKNIQRKKITKLRKYEIKQKSFFGFYQKGLPSINFVQEINNLQWALKLFTELDPNKIDQYRKNVQKYQEEILQIYDGQRQLDEQNQQEL